MTFYRLELHEIMAEPAVAGIHDFLEFRHHRRRRAIVHGINADRLPAQPIDIEFPDRVDGGLTLGAAPQDEE